MAKKSQTHTFLDSDTDEDEHDGPSEGKPPMQEKASVAPKKSYDHTGFAGMFLDSDTDED